MSSSVDACECHHAWPSNHEQRSDKTPPIPDKQRDHPFPFRAPRRTAGSHKLDTFMGPKPNGSS
eukprot:10010652-Lingulodinium_polyedra.AAC.1